MTHAYDPPSVLVCDPRAFKFETRKSKFGPGEWGNGSRTFSHTKWLHGDVVVLVVVVAVALDALVVVVVVVVLGVALDAESQPLKVSRRHNL